MASTAPFRHVDAQRTIVFGRHALEAADDLLGSGYTLLTTHRAAGSAPAVVARAGAVFDIPGGLVEEVSAELRGSVRGDRLVALGGGRVTDVAKALAAADGPRHVVAIPTSLSGAEMTGVHRHAKGVPDAAPRVRPHAVINDPVLSASQPAGDLAASSANALGHALTGLLSDRATPIGRAVAGEAIAQIAGAWSRSSPDRAALALGALLAGWAVDQSGLGLHHVIAQTAVRTSSIGHAQANAAVLPATIAALRARRAAELARLEAALGLTLDSVAQRLRDRAGGDEALTLARDPQLLDRAVDAAIRRSELGRIAPAPDRAELRSIYLAAAGCESS